MAAWMATCGRVIAVVGALGAPAAPPEFAPEFRLNYTVTNLQFGFVAVGMWYVERGSPQ